MTIAERHAAIAFLVTTHSRNEKYIPLVRNLLDTFWSEHPTCFFLTDGALPLLEDIVSFPGLGWVELLCAGLSHIKRKRPWTKHVFHMLEDHCPLRRCDGKRLDRMFDIVLRHDLDAVAFPTYSWPWDETDATNFSDGLVRTWRRVETLQLEGEPLAVVPGDFFRYFQVQPTLWRLDYLEAACSYAMAQGISDAWSFEAMRWPQAGQHYVSRYDWPSVHHGFITQGKVNPTAIVYLDRKHAPRQHRALVREAVGIESPILFDSIQMLVRTKRFIRRSLGGVKNRIKV